MFDSRRILPLESYDDFYVDITSESSDLKTKRSNIKKRKLPRIGEMLRWGVVKEGDVLKAKNHESFVTLLANGNVRVEVRNSMVKEGNRMAVCADICFYCIYGAG